MMRNSEDKISGLQKAAILLISLGPEKSANVFKHLKEEEIEELTLEIANTRSVAPQIKEQIINNISSQITNINIRKEYENKKISQEKMNHLQIKKNPIYFIFPHQKNAKLEIDLALAEKGYPDILSVLDFKTKTITITNKSLNVLKIRVGPT